MHLLADLLVDLPCCHFKTNDLCLTSVTSRAKCTLSLTTFIDMIGAKDFTLLYFGKSVPVLVYEVLE